MELHIYMATLKLNAIMIFHKEDVAPFKGLRIPRSEKILLVQSEILGIWNPEYNSRNPESHYLTIGIRNPSFTDKDWNPVPESRIQTCLGFE